MADMVLSNLQEMISQKKYLNNDSFEYLFANKSRKTTKYSAFLSPDSKLYCSSLNPLFSYEVETSNNKKMLKSFDVISLRDGVLTLLNFFIKHPKPDKIDPLIVVDEKLSSLVPLEWREKVVLRKATCINKSITQKIPKLILCISPDKRALPLEIFKKELSELMESISVETEVCLFFSSLNKRGEEDCTFDTAWKFKIAQEIFKGSSSFKFRIIDWSEYLKENVAGANYIILNPLCYYFTDSYLEHDLLQRGARPVKKNDFKLRDSFFLQLSINHGFTLHRDFEEIHLHDLKLINYIKNESKENEIDLNDYSQLKLATNDLKDYASHLAKLIFYPSKI